MEFLHAKSEFNERDDPHIENNEIRIGYQSETVSPSESVVDKANSIPPHTTSSRRILSSNPAFQNFLKSVRQNAPSTPSGPNDPMDLGSFEVARYTQREITHNPGDSI